jgi:hypothetical protein
MEDMGVSDKTVIDVLDDTFQGRDYDLRLLSINEFKGLSNQLTAFASQYQAPPRIPGKTRYYAGGAAWNNTQESVGKIWFGFAGLKYGADMAAVQTLCLIHDSVVCHDPVTDLIGAHRTEFLPTFYKNIWEGELTTDNNVYGTQPFTKELIENAAQSLNATLRVYDQARELIQIGYLIPVPTRILLKQNKDTLLTQLRHSARDQTMLQIATESKTIPVNDEIINCFIMPIGPKTLRPGPCNNNPPLRLHYGLQHHLKCLLVAYETQADFGPFDDFNWNTLSYKYDKLSELFRKRSSTNLAKTVASSSLVIPIVREFSVYDVVKVRRDEEVFEELRDMLRKTAEPSLVSADLTKFHEDYEAQLADSIEEWRGVIIGSQRKKGLFRDISSLSKSALALTGSMALFSTNDIVSAIIGTGLALPGVYYGLTDLLAGGQDPKRRLFKVLRRYEFHRG